MELSYGKIVDKRKYDSDISMIVVSEYHYKKDVQLDVYNILDEIKTNPGFELLLLENFAKGKIKWSNYNYKKIKSLSKFYKDFDEDLQSKWIRGAPFFGYQNRKSFQTYGVESERLCDEYRLKDTRCMELSLKQYHKGLQALTDEEKKELETLLNFVKTNIVAKASDYFVDTATKIMEQLDKKFAVFNVGDAHRDTMIECLRREKISYSWICPNSFDNYMVPVEFYLIERKDTEKTDKV